MFSPRSLFSSTMMSIGTVTPKKSFAAAVKTKIVPHLEVCIEKLVRNKQEVASEGEEQEECEGLFVELAALPPTGVVRSLEGAGLEGTFFKTQVARGDCIDFQHRVAISPLPNSDGLLQLLVKQKHTYGDDAVLGERADLLVASFLKNDGGSSSLVVTLGDFDLTLSAKYVTA